MTCIMLMPSPLPKLFVMSLCQVISAGCMTGTLNGPLQSLSSHRFRHLCAESCAVMQVSCAWCIRESEHRVCVGTAAAPGAFQGEEVDPCCPSGVQDVANAV